MPSKLVGTLLIQLVCINALRICNVVEFGAKGDGRTLDTSSFQAAIEACKGGGIVRVPAQKTLSPYGRIASGACDDHGSDVCKKGG